MILNKLAYQTDEKYLFNSKWNYQDRDRRSQSYDRDRDRRSQSYDRDCKFYQDRDRDRKFRDRGHALKLIDPFLDHFEQFWLGH